jgi:hypothetical protein
VCLDPEEAGLARCSPCDIFPRETPKCRLGGDSNESAAKACCLWRDRD